MLQAGDELGRTQGGNNNAYCQDNPVSWIDWAAIDGEAAALIDFTRAMLKIRRDHPLLHADRFRHKAERGIDDSIRWLNSDGMSMRETHWHERHNQVIGYLLTGAGASPGEAESALLVIFNASPHEQSFTMPPALHYRWHMLLDTAADGAVDEAVDSGSSTTLAPRSTRIFSAGAAAPGE